MHTRTLWDTLRGVHPEGSAAVSTQHGDRAFCRQLCVLLGRAAGLYEIAILTMHHIYTHTHSATPLEGSTPGFVFRPIFRPARLNPKPSTLLQVQPSMARELFDASFVSCWPELLENMKLQICLCITCTHAQPRTPSERPPPCCCRFNPAWRGSWLPPGLCLVGPSWRSP